MSLLSSSYSKGNDDYLVTLYFCPKPNFEKAALWNGSRPLEKPFHELVTTGKELAVQAIQQCKLDGAEILTSEDPPSKYYLIMSFSNSHRVGAEVALLLDGTRVESNTFKITSKQYDELSEHGIPLLKKKD